MRTKTIAVVYAFGAASPVQISRAADGLADIVFVTDTRDEHSASVTSILRDLCVDLVDLAETDHESAVRRLRSRVDGITTFSERCITLTSRLAADLGLPYHDERTARLLTDKHLQRTALNAALPVATPTRVVRCLDDLAEAAESVGFPLVLKPLSGTAGAFTYRCDTYDVLHETVRRLLRDRRGQDGPSWVAEALLRPGRHPGGAWLADYVSVESLIRDGEVHHFAVTDKLPLAPPFRETGMVSPSALTGERQREVRALTSAALRALGVTHGVTHTEVKLTPDGPRVIEVNGRLGGRVGRLIDRVSDLDPVRLAIENALGGALLTASPVFSGAAVVYGVLPPSRRVKVGAVPTAKTLRRIEEVWKVDRMAGVEEVLDWEQGSGQRVCDVWAETGDLTAVPALLDRLEGAVSAAVSFEPV
ncbi:hypothetical protein [Sphaerisporangium sp. TRM90804]|uniref:ATP-grasp domain-containing protein n=1 Tax=Sphaerisporangium sp. TRM90804 TaxID=3031113 RepID=UPI00244CF3E0|nr:hypothetical protein [Sphaerisporangium sp. TRM90804]MDH2424607.1 hypothetical protein [Sphaerisporangium sp. TRM90804]